MEKIEYKLPEGSVLCLRTCNENLRSHGNFQWKAKGLVKCDDWSEAAECGQGLHGLLWGSGNGELLDWSENAKWLVVEVSAKATVDLGGKVKFPQGKVVYCGDRLTATEFIAALSPEGTVVVGRTATAGYRGTATAGYRGTATAGDGGTATAGDRGTATAGYEGTATAGYEGTATAGDGGTASAGDGGIISIRYWDNRSSRWRVKILYPGEDGIESGVLYSVDSNGSPVKKEGA